MFMTLLLLVVLALQSTAAKAELVSVALTAVVTSVQDDNNDLGGAVQVGDTITGSYVYESTTPDTDYESYGYIVPTIGFYNCVGSPCGFSISAGPFTFRSNPNYGGLWLWVFDGSGPSGSDEFRVQAPGILYEPGLPFTDQAGNGIDWKLTDTSGAALSSDALPVLPPALAEWPTQELTINGAYLQFPPCCPPTGPAVWKTLKIRAVVTSAVLGTVNNGDSDGNGNGIDDTVDTGNGTFSDAGVPQTTGSIVDTGGLSIHIQDSDNPAEGVWVRTESGPGVARLQACGHPVFLGGGVNTTITCGSITVKVAEGSVTVGLYGNAGTVEIPAGTTVKISQNPDGTSRVENLGGSAVTITTGAGTTTLGGGETLVAGTQFQGFFAPVDMNGVLNSVKAGSAVPLKWRLTRIEDGQPVTDLQSVKVRVTGFDCGLGASTDQLEETAAGNSGLQNLGNGYYQYNWKTPKSYAKSCKTLHLDLGEGSADQTALFSFPK